MWYDVVSEGQLYKARLRGKLRLDGLKVTNPVAVGDKVRLHLASGEESNALIENVLPRSNYLVRKSTHKNAHGQLLASNLDQCMLMITLVYPRTSIGFIDRFLVSVEAFRIPTVLLFNKLDLLDEEARSIQRDWMLLYESLGYPCVEVSALEGVGLAKVREHLQGKTTLLSGHSGVGKSTMLNALMPGLHLRTGEVSDFAQKGTHTTTFAEMFDVDLDTRLIDTPGIKELGIMEIGEEELSHYFPEMRALLSQCKFYNCSHTHEPGCVVLESVAQGNIAATRYQSYLSMLHGEDNRK
jgi:ribosome biogenesis GTPase